MAKNHVQVRVTGALTCIDHDGTRPLAADEFHDVMDRIAEHLDDEARITDAGTWGQAGTGDMELYFVLVEPTAGPELNRQVGSIIKDMGEAVGLTWANEPSPVAGAAGPVLSQTRQLCELVAA